MEQLLDSIEIPYGLVHGDKYCDCVNHVFALEKYFQSILDALEICHFSLPKKSPHGKRGKGFWTEVLTRLKNESVRTFNAWKHSGRPRCGPIFEEKKNAHYSYEAELRKQRRLFAAARSEALEDQLVNKNFVQF